MDLDNLHKNSGDGIHTAAMAGTWMALTMGFGGLRIINSIPAFSPYLPDPWLSYSFRITFKGALLEVIVQSESVIYNLIKGNEITFSHKEKTLNLKEGEKTEIPL